MIEFESSKIQPSIALAQVCEIFRGTEEQYQRRTGNPLPVVRVRMISPTSVVVEFAAEVIDVNNNSETPAVERHLRPVQEVPGKEVNTERATSDLR